MPGPEPLAAAGFAAAINVSRETIERLERYAALLIKWNKTVNLVGRSTIADLWRRHMLDSAQLFPYLPKSAGRLVDFGSGAGFPGLVLAIMGAPDVHLVEANARKCAFLREAARVTMRIRSWYASAFRLSTITCSSSRTTSYSLYSM